MKTYEKLYDYLSQQDDFISGERLAQTFSLSRTAIWKAIQTLESKGIVIESIKNRGYKLIAGDLLLTEQISRQTGIAVSLNNNSDSTQIDAKIGIEEGDSAPRLYLASQQKKARGRFGRPFFTSEQGGIYMSLLLRPNLPADQLPPYTLMAASSIVKAISRLTGINCQIKWVNDIYLDDKKIAGILTEAITSVETGLITDVIIGVGINFYVTDLPDELTGKAASLFSQKPTVSRNQIIAEIWKLFLTVPEQDLIKVYKEKSLVLGKQVTFVENERQYSGHAIDITNQGHLLVQLPDGQEKLLLSGEVSLSSWV